MWDMTTGGGLPGQVSMDRQVGLMNHHRQVSMDKTDKRGRPDLTVRTEHQGHESWGKECWYTAAGAGPLGLDNWERTAGTGQTERDIWDRSAGEDSRDNTAKT
jgi:hypothetical protein